MAQALRSEFAGGIPGQSERFRDRRAKQGVSERVEHQRKRAFRHVVILVPDGQLRDEMADRIENGIERITVAGEDHPGGKRPRAFTPECVKALVNDDASVCFTGPRALDRLADTRCDRVRDGLGEFSLQPGRGAEMMKEIGMGSADPAGHGLERHRRGAFGKQKLTRSVERGGAALPRAQALPPY